MADDSCIVKTEPPDPDDIDAGPSEPIPSDTPVGVPDQVKSEPPDAIEESECDSTHIDIAPSQRVDTHRQQSKHLDTFPTPIPSLTLMPMKSELESREIAQCDSQIKTEPISKEDGTKKVTVTPVKLEWNASEQETGLQTLTNLVECKTKIKTEPIDNDVQILSPHAEETADVVVVKREPNSGLPDRASGEDTTFVLEVPEDDENSAWQKTVHLERTANGSYILKEAHSDPSTKVKFSILNRVPNQHTSKSNTNRQSTVERSTDISTALINERVDTHTSTNIVLNGTSKTLSVNCDQNQPSILEKFIKSEPNVELNDGDTLSKPSAELNKGNTLSKQNAKLNDGDTLNKSNAELNDGNILNKPIAQLNDGDTLNIPNVGHNYSDTLNKPNAELNDGDTLSKQNAKLNDGDTLSKPNLELNKGNTLNKPNAQPNYGNTLNKPNALLNDSNTLSKQNAKLNDGDTLSKPNLKLNKGNTLSKRNVELKGNTLSKRNVKLNKGNTLSKRNVELNKGNTLRKRNVKLNDGDTFSKIASPLRTYSVNKNKAYTLFSSVPETLTGGVASKVHLTSEDVIDLSRPSKKKKSAKRMDLQVRKSKAIKKSVIMKESLDASNHRHRSPGDGWRGPRLPWTSWGGVFDVEPDVEPDLEDVTDRSTVADNVHDGEHSPTIQEPVKPMSGLPRGWSCELCPGRPKFETYAENFLHHEECHNLLPKTRRVDGGAGRLCCFCGRPAETNNKRRRDGREPLCADCDDTADANRRRPHFAPRSRRSASVVTPPRTARELVFFNWPCDDL